MSQRQSRAPGLGAGPAALWSAVGFLLRTPRAWPWAAVPGLIAIVLSGALIWLSVGRLGPGLGDWLLPDAQSWYAQGARVAVRWLSSLVAAYLALLGSLVAAPTLGAPALEQLVRSRERELGAPERPPQSFFFELWCGLKCQVFALSLSLPAWLLLWLIGLAVPPLAPVVLALQILLASLMIAWNLLDYPLTLRGVPLRARLALLRRHASSVLGFGLAFALVFSVPAAGVFLLPVGVVAATELVWRLIRLDPQQAQALGVAVEVPCVPGPGITGRTT
jgi:CysZ protein